MTKVQPIRKSKLLYGWAASIIVEIECVYACDQITLCPYYDGRNYE